MLVQHPRLRPHLPHRIPSGVSVAADSGHHSGPLTPSVQIFITCLEGVYVGTPPNVILYHIIG